MATDAPSNGTTQRAWRSGMIEPEDLPRIAGLACSLLAEGADHEEVIARLRREGASKGVTVYAIQQAQGLSHGDAKRLVHHSDTWADRRQADEETEGQFFRALFIMCVLGEGTVEGPAADIAEWQDRQDRARRLLIEVAGLVPGGSRRSFEECMAANLLGQAFTKLVDAVEHAGAGDRERALLAEAARALCLDELLGDSEPPTDDRLLRAARRVMGTSPSVWKNTAT